MICLKVVDKMSVNYLMVKMIKVNIINIIATTQKVGFAYFHGCWLQTRIESIIDNPDL
jgi:hypothetical protein